MNHIVAEKAMRAKSAAELKALAEENGIKLSEEEADNYFTQLNRQGELGDEELDNVAGGGCSNGKAEQYEMFPPNAHVMRRGYQYCYQATTGHSCMSEYWIVREQNAELGSVSVECPRCGMRECRFVGDLVLK